MADLSTTKTTTTPVSAGTAKVCPHHPPPAKWSKEQLNEGLLVYFEENKIIDPDIIKQIRELQRENNTLLLDIGMDYIQRFLPAATAAFPNSSSTNQGDPQAVARFYDLMDATKSYLSPNHAKKPKRQRGREE